MPFLLGRDAIRRTIRYLEQGKLIFRKNVKVFTINYNSEGDHHKGTRDFAYWNLCQVMYKNPDVQILQLQNMFPMPFIRCWLDTGEDVLMDCFDKSNVQILDHLIKILGQSREQTEEQKEEKPSIAKFGSGCARHCICEIPGQVPCPIVVPIPKHMRGKYKQEHGLWPKKLHAMPE